MCGYLSVAHTFVFVMLIFPHKVNYKITHEVIHHNAFCILQMINSPFGEKIIIGQWVQNKRNKYPKTWVTEIWELIHSGISYSLSDNCENGYSDFLQWGSNQCQFNLGMDLPREFIKQIKINIKSAKGNKIPYSIEKNMAIYKYFLCDKSRGKSNGDHIFVNP